MFFGGDNLDDLDDIPLDDGMKEEFNQVLSTSKENGGLLASIGLDKQEANAEESLNEESQEEDPIKKSDFFDNSKDPIKDLTEDNKQASEDEDIDLGFSSAKKSDQQSD